jgi:hypothetical protein
MSVLMIYFAGKDRDFSDTFTCSIKTYGDGWRLEYDIKGEYIFEIFGTIQEAKARRSVVGELIYIGKQNGNKNI